MSDTKNILVIDDEPDIRELLYITVTRMGHDCITACNVSEAYSALKQHTFHLCLTDMNLPDGSGIEIIEHIHKTLPELPVAMITAYGSMEAAVNAMRAGAFDYLTKPIDLKVLRTLISSSLKQPNLPQKVEPLNKSPNLLGESASILKLKKQINKVAISQAPVFIHGESGSGKELVARLIHSKSQRFDGPFIAVNCGAIPTELVESEFFGHEKGSFTGANEKKEGLFSAANGGTLFLDEIADLPLAMQVKLLRAIQEKAIRTVGGNKEETIDVRILSASHKNLPEEIQQGHFREDLYYRINVIELKVPSLRERQEDILLLANHFLDKLCERYETPLVTLSESAKQSLQAHSFQGNVRELENVLERAFTLTDHNIIDADDLLLKKAHSQFQTEQQIETSTEKNEHTSLNPEQAYGDIEGFLGGIETTILMAALEKTRWNKTAAAELLGISFRAMRYKLKKYDIK